MKDFEECASLVGMKYAVWVPITQKIQYSFIKSYSANNSPIFGKNTKTLSGFIGRVWDH